LRKKGRRIVEALELPKEVVFNLPIIQALGAEDVSITNYKSLMEIGTERVRINTADGQVVFTGKKLILKHVTSESITVSGDIDSIEFVR